MNTSDEPFGTQLLNALRQLQACHLISADDDGIQRLKSADREATVKMFYGSSYETIQKVKTEEPDEIARFLVSQAEADAAAAAIILLVT